MKSGRRSRRGRNKAVGLASETWPFLVSRAFLRGGALMAAAFTGYAYTKTAGAEALADAARQGVQQAEIGDQAEVKAYLPTS